MYNNFCSLPSSLVKPIHNKLNNNKNQLLLWRPNSACCTFKISAAFLPFLHVLTDTFKTLALHWEGMMPSFSSWKSTVGSSSCCTFTIIFPCEHRPANPLVHSNGASTTRGAFLSVIKGSQMCPLSPVCSSTSHLCCSLHLCSYQGCFSARLTGAEIWSIYAVCRAWVVFAWWYWKYLLFVKELSPFSCKQVFADMLISCWKSRVARTGTQNWFFNWISKGTGALKILSRTQSTSSYVSKQQTCLTGFSWIQNGRNLMELFIICI